MAKRLAARGKRGGRPRKPDHERLGVQIALRVDPALLERIDEHVDRLRADQPAVPWSRGSAIRDLMLKGLAHRDGNPRG